MTTDGPPVTLQSLSDEELGRMSQAAAGFIEVIGEAYDAGRPILSELIGETPFLQWEHYPPDDLYDPEAGVLIFYHAHSPEDRQSAEHGHFHCFAECADVPADQPAIAKPRKRSGRRLCHVVGVSIDMNGIPTELFVPNQWVTGEWLYPAEIAASLARRFASVGAGAARPLRWMARLITLFEPQVDHLLTLRDERLGAGRGGSRMARDRSLDILAQVPIDIDAQIEAIETESELRSTRRRRDERFGITI